MQYQDYFSGHAQTYATFRPSPPSELIQALTSLVATRELAWDCATGNGQAALLLADYFPKVVATDASTEQIAAAIPHDRVLYSVALAEDSGLLDHSVDLITVGAAIHWFDQIRFYEEAKRVLKPDGIIALWGYNRFEIRDGSELLTQAIQNVVDGMEPFLPQAARSVWQGYDELFFPFEEKVMPCFFIRRNWTLDQVLGFFRSTSPVISWIDQEGEAPVEDLFQHVSQAWGENHQRTVQWKLLLKVGRVS